MLQFNYSKNKHHLRFNHRHYQHYLHHLHRHHDNQSLSNWKRNIHTDQVRSAPNLLFCFSWESKLLFNVPTRNSQTALWSGCIRTEPNGRLLLLCRVKVTATDCTSALVYLSNGCPCLRSSLQSCIHWRPRPPPHTGTRLTRSALVLCELGSAGAASHRERDSVEAAALRVTVSTCVQQQQQLHWCSLTVHCTRSLTHTHTHTHKHSKCATLQKKTFFFNWRTAIRWIKSTWVGPPSSIPPPSNPTPKPPTAIDKHADRKL